MLQSQRTSLAAGALFAGAAFTGVLAVVTASDSASTMPERVSTELTANTWTGSTQYEPAVAAGAEGGLVVAWSSRRQEDGAYGVYAQQIDPLGRPVGTETHVNQHIPGAQASPAVAIDPTTGRALLVWESTHQDGSGAGIVGRWFTPSVLGLLPATDEFAVNSTREGDQSRPSVAITPGGAALVTWTSGERAVGRVIASASDARAMTGEITLGPAGSHGPIAATAGDGFVVVGAARDLDRKPAPLWVQRVSASGETDRIGSLASVQGQQDIEPSMAVDGEGAVTVVWMRRGERGYSVVRRDFDQSGAPINQDTLIARSGERWLSGAAVAVAPDGRSVVSWNEEDRTPPAQTDGVGRRARDSDVLALRFDSARAIDGDAERVNTTTDGQQRLTVGSVATRAVWTGQGQIVHAWHGRTERDSSGVGVSISRPRALTAPEPIAFDPRPAVTPGQVNAGAASAAPVFDEGFVPEPQEFNVRGGGPDFGFLGIQSTGWRPPDPEIAVGPDHVVVVANAQIRFRRKSDGGQTFSQNLTGGGGFWGAQGAGGFVFDPIAQYDTYTDRFIVAATEREGSQQYIDLAISDDDDPNGSWNKFRMNVTSFGDDIDFPNMGIDADAVYFTSDFFGSPAGNWIFILDKADLIAGTLTMNAVQTATFPNVLGCVMNYDAASPAQYFATTYFGNNTQIRLKAVTDGLGTPVLHEFTLGVPAYTQPPGADQLGSSNLVSTVDYRIKHGVVRDGSMWVAHSTNDPDGDGPFSQVPVARVRWLEIELNGWPTSGMDPTLKQSGTINDGLGVHNWQPDITVDADGNAGLVFSRSSTDDYVSMARAVRRATDPPGTFRQMVEMQQSTSPELEDRWGDYSGIQEDPSSPGTFWGHHEYRTSSWRTWVGRFSPQTPNPLDFGLLTPAPDAVDVDPAPTLDWEDAQDATSYDVTIATDPDLINTVAVTSVAGSSWDVPGGSLACGVQYYWGVVANGVGGTSDSTPGVISFTTGLAADLNGDGVVDTADLGVLIAAFGGSDPIADLNGDGVVDTADLGVLVGAFGLSCD